MYIESYLIWGAVIWIIYLLYRTYKWSKAFHDIEKIYSALKNNKRSECYQLWHLVEAINKEVLPKCTLNKRKNILRNEARTIISDAEKNTYVDEYLPGTSNGETVIIEGSPYDRIDLYFGSETAHCRTKEARVQSLYAQLNEHIYEK